MSLQPSSEHLPITKSEFNPNTHCPEIIRFVADIKESIPDYLSKYAEDSLFTKRHPGASNEVILPQADSIREQLTMFSEDPTFSDRLKHGFIFKADGVKTQLVSQYAGEAAGDAYIAANLEILLRSAKALDCDLAYGIYSGDETTGLFIPKNAQQIISTDLINQKIKEVSDEYYHSDPSTADYFNQVEKQTNDAINQENERIKQQNTGYENSQENIRLNLTHKVKTIAESYLERPQSGKEGNTQASTTRTLRERSLFAGFIDIAGKENAVDAETPVRPPEAVDLNKLIIETLSQPRLANSDHQRYDESEISSWPQKYQNLYYDAVSNYKDADPIKFNEMRALIELSVYEPVFPGELEIRKFGILKEDLQNAISFKRSIRVIRFADTRLKDVNDQSHQMGDDHMIGTARSIQNIFKRYGVDPHQAAIKYYQHHGSFVMTIEDDTDKSELFDQVSLLLEDSIELNREIYTQEISYGRLKNQKRAKPFIVATTHIKENMDASKEFTPLTIKNLNDIEKFFESTQGDLEVLKKHQLINEAWENFQASSIRIPLSESIAQLANPERGIAAPSIEEIIRQVQIIENLFSRLNIDYMRVRPRRAEYLEDPVHRLFTARHRLESQRESSEPRSRN